MKQFLLIAVTVLAVAGVLWLTLDAYEGGGKKDDAVLSDDLDSGKHKEGDILKTKTGLKYTEVKIGTGKSAKPGDTVVVHYTGAFPDGKKFDSSRDRDEPFTVTIGKTSVIKGWHEGLTGMKEGGKRTLVIPPDLAYGPEGRPPVIPRNATLHFDIEVLKVK